jgi:hypothetical protein
MGEARCVDSKRKILVGPEAGRRASGAESERPRQGEWEHVPLTPSDVDPPETTARACSIWTS